VSPEKFASFDQQARAMGFVHVASGPMVRSSYHADEFNGGVAQAFRPPS
jgi:lipoyl synthase